jgi:hypothetical protein
MNSLIHIPGLLNDLVMTPVHNVGARRGIGSGDNSQGQSRGLSPSDSLID